ncbi:hypothetical protein EXIGLDRAFT_481236 [Exidia glandulosa HHB12029]|uniref:Uncharacterized protein n=1 Tax=Exidia glandulosa HHB12029 TaxID=1314781 RepID=A0A166NFW1_EXIGL|nr:hypothetical protein EXIGLDRAFT_481236 [Exidia glandulosa HHB12029]
MREVRCGLSTGPVGRPHCGTGDGDIGLGAKRDATSTRASMWVHVPTSASISSCRFPTRVLVGARLTWRCTGEEETSVRALTVAWVGASGSTASGCQIGSEMSMAGERRRRR